MKKSTKCYIYNNMLKTIVVKEFDTLKSAKLFVKNSNSYNMRNNMKHEFFFNNFI